MLSVSLAARVTSTRAMRTRTRAESMTMKTVKTSARRRRPKTRATSESDGVDAESSNEWGAEPWDESVNGPDPLGDDVLLAIVRSELEDDAVNRLTWRALGYRARVDLDAETLTAVEVWTPDEVFPNWKKRYPQPPDVLGVTRKYDPKIDAPVKEACAALTRSVPEEHKQGLKTTLRPLGWKGFTMDGLTPNMTRRAQVANWLLFYRRELRGVSVEELRARRDARRAREEAEGKTDRPTGTTKQGVV